MLNKKILLPAFLALSIGAILNVAVADTANMTLAAAAPVSAAPASNNTPTAPIQIPALNNPATPSTTMTAVPPPPTLNAKGFVLMDGDSGKVLAMQSADQRMAPASLTKMMTAYVASAALQAGRIHMTDPVPVSEKAWRMGGSKMFIRIGTDVAMQDLLQGIIVDSGNDACVAVAEHVAGSEDSFVGMMNQAALALGMTGTHFVNSTGMPDPNHYSTPHDLAILARALIYHYPQDYRWYSQKWFTYNQIRQPNRNRLLWRDPTVDGVKTGHTDDAGFCLVASGKRGNTRLITVVMGAPTDSMRAESSTRLMNYGFRFFETHTLYPAGTKLSNVRIWQGRDRTVNAGVLDNLYVTLPPGQYQNLSASMDIMTPVKAPITQGHVVGNINIFLNGEKISSAPIVALQDDPKGGMWTRMSDAATLAIKHFFNKKSEA